MRRLVIDDIRDFGPEYDYARNLDVAGRMLAEWRWDQIWLDNDLGDGQEVYTLIKEIERMYHEEAITLDVGLFVIHTANPVAAQNMVSAFEGMPYSWVVINPETRRVKNGRM